MSKVQVVQVSPTLVRGRLRRLVVTGEGVQCVQVWSGQGWLAEPSDLISPVEIQHGIEAPPIILRALGVPEGDWPPVPSPTRLAHPLLLIWPLVEWAAFPVPLSALLAA